MKAFSIWLAILAAALLVVLPVSTAPLELATGLAHSQVDADESPGDADSRFAALQQPGDSEEEKEKDSSDGDDDDAATGYRTGWASTFTISRTQDAAVVSSVASSAELRDHSPRGPPTADA